MACSEAYLGAGQNELSHSDEVSWRAEMNSDTLESRPYLERIAVGSPDVVASSQTGHAHGNMPHNHSTSSVPCPVYTQFADWDLEPRSSVSANSSIVAGRTSQHQYAQNVANIQALWIPDIYTTMSHVSEFLASPHPHDGVSRPSALAAGPYVSINAGNSIIAARHATGCPLRTLDHSGKPDSPCLWRTSIC